VTKAKKPTKPATDNNKNMPSLLVKVTAEVRDTFCFHTNQLNWDTFLEMCVKGVRQYIMNDDLSSLLHTVFQVGPTTFVMISTYREIKHSMSQFSNP
jgi:hypothetical protein